MNENEVPRYIRRHALAVLTGSMRMRRNRKRRARINRILRRKFG